MLKFYYNTGPNPMKIALCLEEMGLEYEAIPVDEHVERRFAYYAVGGVDYRVAKNLYVGAYIRMYFNEIEIDDKWRVHDRVDNAQIRPGIELGFMF